MPTCQPARVNIVIHEGGTFDHEYQWVDKEGTALDLTDFTARMTIRTELSNDTPLLEVPFSTNPWTADVETGIFLTDAVDGTYKIYIRNEETLGLCAEHKDLMCPYDLFLYNPGGEAQYKQYGTAYIKAAVTRWPSQP